MRTETQAEQTQETLRTATVVPLRQRRSGWEPWVDDAAVARHFDVSPRTVRRWLMLGVPSRRIGGVRRYRLSEVEAWHERRETPA
jgi:hypothetical protein